MEHRNEHTETEVISDAENRLIALIAAIAVEQVVAQTTGQFHTEQQGAAA